MEVIGSDTYLLVAVILPVLATHARLSLTLVPYQLECPCEEARESLP